MFSLSRKYRQLLGLDITTSSIKLIELTMAGGQYRVESYAAEPTPTNAMNEKTLVDPEAADAGARANICRTCWLISAPLQGFRSLIGAVRYTGGGSAMRASSQCS